MDCLSFQFLFPFYDPVGNGGAEPAYTFVEVFGEDNQRYGRNDAQDAGSQVSGKRFVEQDDAYAYGCKGFHGAQYGGEGGADVFYGFNQCEVGYYRRY